MDSGQADLLHLCVKSVGVTLLHVQLEGTPTRGSSADHQVLLHPQHADNHPTSHHTNCNPHHCEHQVIEPLHLSPHPPGYTDLMVVTQKKLVNAEHFLLDLSVMVKFMKVARLTQRKNANHFMFAQLMELEVWPSTASLLEIVLLKITYLISFPYLCPSGDFSKFHIFLLRSDKHTSHLVKKKNVRNIDIKFDTYNLLESPFSVFPYHSMTHWFLQTTSKIISSRINNKLWCLVSLPHHRY